MGENIFYILYSIFYMLQLVGLKKMGNSAGHTFSKNRCKTEGYGARSPCKGRQGERSKRCDSIKRSCGIVETD